ncbi:unnamed protein product [Angiostrongylus costaricensis]|uniref:Endo/exonuclease/phosphatase domain-containing protein n=1 Tax=Angiostrongylus costaricensis TaxID=334426 RepID=A0A0R3P9G9_ANGCS|nr:unnamed protein product [Angiostrongylus costaricensis]
MIGDFNAKIGPTRTSEERHIGTHGLEWNEQGEWLSEFIMATKAIHSNLRFQKPHPQRWTWELLNGVYHNEIDYIIVNKRLYLTGVAVVAKFCRRSHHRLLRGRFHFSRKGEKAGKLRNGNPGTTVNWDLFNSLVGCWEDAVVDSIDEEYYRFIQHLHVSAMKAESSEVTKKRLFPGTLDLIRQRGIARAAGNRELTFELAKQCRQAIKEDLKERRAAVIDEAAEAVKSIRKAHRRFANYKTKMIALLRPNGTVTMSRKVMEKIIHDYNSHLFNMHVILLSYEIKESGSQDRLSLNLGIGI